MMLRLENWRGYGYCKTCTARAQEPCKGFLRLRPHKNRQTYEEYRKWYAKILSEHFQREIKPDEIEQYLTGGTI